MKIIFVGYMASGKSTLGKRVAKRLAIPFVDMDKEIEKKAGQSISNIFSNLGEKTFRTMESDFIEELIVDNTPKLISTGGGTPCFGDNMDKLSEMGLTVYLNRSAKELAHRIAHSKKSRPLTDNLSEEELLTFVERHLIERESYYMKSELILERSQQTTDGIIEALLPYSDVLERIPLDKGTKSVKQ